MSGAFPYLPGQSGYNGRLRGTLSVLERPIRMLAADADLWPHPVWLVDSTPVECARSRPNVDRSAWPGPPAQATAQPLALILGLGRFWGLDACGAGLLRLGTAITRLALIGSRWRPNGS